MIHTAQTIWSCVFLNLCLFMWLIGSKCLIVTRKRWHLYLSCLGSDYLSELFSAWSAYYLPLKKTKTFDCSSPFPNKCIFHSRINSPQNPQFLKADGIPCVQSWVISLHTEMLGGIVLMSCRLGFTGERLQGSEGTRRGGHTCKHSLSWTRGQSAGLGHTQPQARTHTAPNRLYMTWQRLIQTQVDTQAWACVCFFVRVCVYVCRCVFCACVFFCVCVCVCVLCAYVRVCFIYVLHCVYLLTLFFLFCAYFFGAFLCLRLFWVYSRD